VELLATIVLEGRSLGSFVVAESFLLSITAAFLALLKLSAQTWSDMGPHSYMLENDLKYHQEITYFGQNANTY
jgi:hypothetical protein